MSDIGLPSGLFPRSYLAPLSVAKFDQVIIVNWLGVEIEKHAERRLPLLAQLSGHRNREVWEFVKLSYDDFMSRWFEEHPV